MDLHAEFHGIRSEGRVYIDVLDLAGRLYRFAAETRREKPDSIAAAAYEQIAAMLENLRLDEAGDAA